MMEFIESVARRAGTEAMKYFKHEKTNRISSKKTVKDLVSTADKAVKGDYRRDQGNGIRNMTFTARSPGAPAFLPNTAG